MELIETTPATASQVIEKGNRRIVTDSGEIVEWINLNNQTCMAWKGNRGGTRDLEKIKLFIKVPRNSKTVY